MTGLQRICSTILFAAIAFGGVQQAFAECGTASYYSSGARTANGEAYNPGGISAAHRSLPFGSIVNVTNQRTGRSVQVRINDRGPFIGGRIIDLSTGAKNALGMGGLAPVCIEVASYGSGRRGRVQVASYGSKRVARKSGTVRYASARKGVRYASRNTGRRYASAGRVRTAYAKPTRAYRSNTRRRVIDDSDDS